MKKEDLVVGREYWLNEDHTAWGTYLGERLEGSNLICFSPENNNGAFLISSNVNVGGKEQKVIAFCNVGTHWTPKGGKPFVVTRIQMQKIYDIACSTWKSRIEALVVREMGTFGDSGFLDYDEVNEMFMNATPAQSEVLKEIFPGYQEKEKNAFIRSFPIDELNSVSSRLFGDPHTFQIARGGVPSSRPDMYGKSFYVKQGHHVNLLPGDGGMGTVIEIVKD